MFKVSKVGSKASKTALRRTLLGKGRFKAAAGRVGSTIKGAGIVAIQEGIEEGTQQILGNIMAKIGFDDSRKLFEGVIESMIAGAGSGGVLGGITQGSVKSTNRIVNEAVAAGVTEEEIDTLINEVAQEIKDNAPIVDQTIKSLGAAAAGFSEEEGDVSPEEMKEYEKDVDEDVLEEINKQLESEKKGKRKPRLPNLKAKKTLGKILSGIRTAVSGGANFDDAIEFASKDTKVDVESLKNAYIDKYSKSIKKLSATNFNGKITRAKTQESLDKIQEDLQKYVGLADPDKILTIRDKILDKMDVLAEEDIAPVKKKRRTTRQSVRQYIKEAGGIDPASAKASGYSREELRSISSEDLLRKGGQDMPTLAERMIGEGILTPDDTMYPSAILKKYLSDKITRTQKIGDKADSEYMKEYMKSEEGLDRQRKRQEAESLKPQTERVAQLKVELAGKESRVLLEAAETANKFISKITNTELKAKYIKMVNSAIRRANKHIEKGGPKEKAEYKKTWHKLAENVISDSEKGDTVKTFLRGLNVINIALTDASAWEKLILEKIKGGLVFKMRAYKASHMMLFGNETLDSFINKSINIIKKSPAPTIRMLGEKLPAKVAQALEAYDFSMARMERLLEKISGYKKSIIREVFFDNVKAARTKSLVFINEQYEKMKNFLGERGGMDFLTPMSVRHDIGSTKLSGLNILSIFGALQDKGAASRILQHGLRIEQVFRDKIIYITATQEDFDARVAEGDEAIMYRDIEAAVTPEMRQLYDYMVDWYKDMHPKVAQAVFEATGLKMGYVPGYFGQLSSEKNVIGFEEELMWDEYLRSGRVLDDSIRMPDFVKERASDTGKPLYLQDPMMKFSSYLSRAGHYMFFGDALNDMKKVLDNPKFEHAVKKKAGGAYWDILAKYYDQMVTYSHTIADDPVSRTIRVLRNNSAIATLGFNFLSSFRQTLSSFAAMTMIKPESVMFGWKEVLRDVSAAAEEVKLLSPEVYHRVMERFFSEDLRRVGEMKLDIGGNFHKFERASMYMLRKLDQLTVLSIYKGAFAEEMTRSKDPMKAKSFADEVIRRTQPQGDLIDLPAAFRGPEVQKMFTMFMNQLNQNYQILSHDILGKRRTGQINNLETATKLFWAWIFPALLMGFIGRGKPPEDSNDVARDLATYPIASMLYGGMAINSWINGYEQPYPLPLQSISSTFRALRTLGEGTPETAFKYAGPAIARIAGVPGASQIRRTLSGVGDIATGKTKDPRRLIYSEWQLSKSGERSKDLLPESLNIRWAGKKKRKATRRAKSKRKLRPARQRRT